MRFLFCLPVLLALNISAQTNTNPITRQTIAEAEKILGLNFTDAKREMLLPGLKDQTANYEVISKFPLSNGIPPALVFNPLPVGFKFETARRKMKFSSPGKVKLPSNPDDLAFYSVAELGALIKSRQITSEKLTRFFLERFHKYDSKLLSAVTLTEDLAMAQARRADAEIAAGKYHGPLHGIP